MIFQARQACNRVTETEMSAVPERYNELGLGNTADGAHFSRNMMKVI